MAEWEARPISISKRVLIRLTPKMMTPISVPRESNQLGFQQGVTEGWNLKEVILDQISQLQLTVNKLEDEAWDNERERMLEIHKCETERLRAKIEALNIKILKLEAQVRELGEYNEDLSAQLRQEPMEGLEEDEDLQLEPKLVEPMTDTAAID
uniref:Predicted protein n=1 Tax=Physcomitrium patens TaxID=3218 RepID=A9U2D8_PHYPA